MLKGTGGPVLVVSIFLETLQINVSYAQQLFCFDMNDNNVSESGWLQTCNSGLLIKKPHHQWMKAEGLDTPFIYFLP